MMGFIASAATAPILKSGPPAFPASFGIDQLVFWDDMKTLGSIDVNNTKAANFNWWLHNYTLFFGASFDYGASDPSWFVQSDSSTLDIQNNATTSLQTAGTQLGTTCYLGPTPPRFRSSCLLNATKPFYVEIRNKFSIPGALDKYAPSFFLGSNTLSQAGADNVTYTPVGEIDVIECSTPNVLQTVHKWDGTTSGSPSNSDSQNANLSGWNSTAFHNWGLTLIPMAFNGGTGLVRWTIDGVQSRPDVTWTSGGTFSVIEQTTDFAMFFSAAHNSHYLIDFCGAWRHS